MRLVTLRVDGSTRAGRVDGDEVVELVFSDVGALLASGPDWRSAAQRGQGPSRPLADADLAPLVPRPPKILCVGSNYAKHIAEMGNPVPQYPTVFAKFARALIGARDDIVLPRVSQKLDWEAELAVVIGREVRHADEGAARDAIAGYTILNDVSARDFQRRTTQFLQGKTFESTTPLGPALVTLDEFDDPDDLAIRCEVDGQVMQDDRTSDLLFSPVDIIRYLSAIVTLEPGDVIATGTPSGVGAGRDPQVFLQSGQVMGTAIEGLGECVNRCIREGTAPPAGGLPTRG